MGDEAFMLSQLEQKLERRLWQCIKMKIGAIDFETELSILQSIRKRFTPEPKLSLRVDANGAFPSKKDALNKLKQLIGI